MLGDGWD